MLEITLYNVYDKAYQLEISYHIETFGKYIPATRYQPEEYPEVIATIESIWYNDKRLKNLNSTNTRRIEEAFQEAIDNTDYEDL